MAVLARRLTEMGLSETEESVTVKINRGAFPAWFLFAAMKAIGRDVVWLDDLWSFGRGGHVGVGRQATG